MTRYRRSRSRSRRSAPQRAAVGLSRFEAGEVFAAIARAAAAPDEIQAGADSQLSSDFEDSVSSWNDNDAANCPGSRVERLLETAEPEDIVLFDTCVQRYSLASTKRFLPTARTKALPAALRRAPCGPASAPLGESKQNLPMSRACGVFTLQSAG